MCEKQDDIILNDLLKHIPKTWEKILYADNNKQLLYKIWANEVFNKDNEILPAKNKIFRAFHYFIPNDIKIIIIGQDPYKSSKHACGLSFSIPKNCEDIPPSLINIFKCLYNYKFINNIPKHGSLKAWVLQGILLLNTFLTYNANANAPSEWNLYTETVIHNIQLHMITQPLIFFLWGNHAKNLNYINNPLHKIFKWTHPSPLCDNNLPPERKFANCNNFSASQQYLLETKKSPINWRLNYYKSDKIIKIFTDGSYSSSRQRGGWGVYIRPNIKIYGETPQPVTNQRSELHGIIEAFKYARENNFVSPYKIITDSTYCTGILNKWIYKWRNSIKKWNKRSNLDYLEKIWYYLVMERDRFKGAIHIRGHLELNDEMNKKIHSRVKGNNQADKLSQLYLKG